LRTNRERLQELDQWAEQKTHSLAGRPGITSPSTSLSRYPERRFRASSAVRPGVPVGTAGDKARCRQARTKLRHSWARHSGLPASRSSTGSVDVDPQELVLSVLELSLGRRTAAVVSRAEAPL